MYLELIETAKLMDKVLKLREYKKEMLNKATVLGNKDLYEQADKSIVPTRLTKNDIPDIISSDKLSFQKEDILIILLRNEVIEYVGNLHKDDWDSIPTGTQKTELEVAWLQKRQEFTNALNIIYKYKNWNSHCPDLTLPRFKWKPNEVQLYVQDVGDYIEKKKAADHLIELRKMAENPDKAIFEQKVNELFDIYSATPEGKSFVMHWLVQCKRGILGLEKKKPIMLIFFSEQQDTGKSYVAEVFSQVINKRVVQLTFNSLSGRFAPTQITSDAVIWIDEMGSIDRNNADAIKKIITTPKMTIEKKYGPQVTVNVLANLILTTNQDPKALFYFDTESRRNGIVKFTKYNKVLTKEELLEKVQEIWDNTPDDYIVPPEDVESAAKAISNEDDEVFEVLCALWLANEWENFKTPAVLEQSIKNTFTNLPVIPASKIRNWCKTNEDKGLIETKKYKCNGAYHFRPTNKLIEQFKEHGQETQCESMPVKLPQSTIDDVTKK